MLDYSPAYMIESIGNVVILQYWKPLKSIEFWMESKILLFAYEVRWGWNHSNILKLCGSCDKGVAQLEEGAHCYDIDDIDWLLVWDLGWLCQWGLAEVEVVLRVHTDLGLETESLSVYLLVPLVDESTMKKKWSTEWKLVQDVDVLEGWGSRGGGPPTSTRPYISGHGTSRNWL